MIIARNYDFYILTNAHVVDGATRVYVLLTDGRRFKAELCGSDDIVDVAVLKIVPEEDEGVDGSDLVLDLPVAELGDSDRLEVGQFVSRHGLARIASSKTCCFCSFVVCLWALVLGTGFITVPFIFLTVTTGYCNWLSWWFRQLLYNWDSVWAETMSESCRYTRQSG
jgi:hypothetical protein